MAQQILGSTEFYNSHSRCYPSVKSEDLGFVRTNRVRIIDDLADLYEDITIHRYHYFCPVHNERSAVFEGVFSTAGV